jgi:hypothetical protein
MPVQVTTYNLRGGQIIPVLSNCGGLGVPEGFVVQTFGVDKVVTDVSDAKVLLLASSDMQGQKPGDVEDPAYIQSTYSSASYSSRAMRTTDGDLVFSASESHVLEFIEEESIGVG